MGEVIAMTGKRGDPQIEDGYLKIANELAEALCRITLSPRESRCVWFIIRMSYGYNRTWARITRKQWAEGTGLDPSNVYRTLARLEDRNIIEWQKQGVDANTQRNRKIKLQKNYKKWKQGVSDDLKCHTQHLQGVTANTSLPIISERQFKYRGNPHTKTCIQCHQKFIPVKQWHTTCDHCYKNPPHRAQPKDHKVPPCTECGWQPGPGYEGMDVNNVCLDCRQKGEEIG